MKNHLITLITIVAGFSITYYVLINFYKHESELGAFPNIPANNATSQTENDSDTTSDDNTNSSTENSSDDSNEEVPDITPHLASIDSWSNYYKENINLSSDFVPLDAEGMEIEKDPFLEQLTSGDYVPVKLMTSDAMYQLKEINSSEHEEISKVVADDANIAYEYFMKEGTSFPEFAFSDINGTEFSTETTKDKIIILMCWSMDSKDAVKEFPELNSLYDKYEAYEDVVFISLAFDKSNDLRKFLTKNEFRYPVISNKQEFITEQIQVTTFPTHIIVDEYGNIEKMVNNVTQLTAALEKIAEPDLTEFNEGM